MSKKTRLTVEYPQQTSEVLGRLQERYNRENHADVIKIALQVLSFLDKKDQEGWEFNLGIPDDE